MNFCINKVIIWFGPDDEPRILGFEPNKINVITGDSSTGKSNIIAIINYCLLSGQSNIVEPIVNQFTSWYGLEFSFNGKFYSIARQRPQLEEGNSDVYFNEGKFDQDFRPSSTNMQLEGARRKLNSLLGYKRTNGEYYQFRRNFIFNILTEDIITSPYIYLNRSFFSEERYNEQECIKVFEDAISPDIEKLQELKSKLEDLEREIKNEEKINKKIDTYEGIVNRCANILINGGLLDRDVIQLPHKQQLSQIMDLIDSTNSLFADKDENSKKQIFNLRQELFKESLHYAELLNTENQRNKYLAHLNVYKDSIEPLEIIKEESKKQPNSIWSKYVIDSLSISLNRIKGEIANSDGIQKINNTLLLESKKKIDNLKAQIKSLEKMSEKYSLDAPSFRLIGIVEEIIKDNEKILKRDSNLNRIDTNDKYQQIDNVNNEIKKIEEENYGKWIKLDDSCQEFFNQCHSIEHYEGAKTIWDRNNLTLKLRGRNEGFSYTVVGSQSNYMFMHLFFFLGLHKYLLENVDSRVFQFLFIDQPSIPYYEGSDNVNSTDRLKLEDAFLMLNNFVKYVVEDLKKNFQIILIEHAPESYWINDLKYFKTCAKFLDGNALIPQKIIDKYSE